MPFSFRQAICNEIFKDWKFDEACKAIRTAGYTGIEIAPFTLAGNPAAITQTERARYRDMIVSEGLEFCGLHWLMVSPKGLHVTTPDSVVRARSWDHIRALVDLCADIAGGTGGVMVFGSPQQRSTTGGISRAEATKYFADGLAAVAPLALQRSVTILIEALPAGQSDVVTSLDEAAFLVDRIGSPAVRTMFDTHNAVDEIEPHPVLVDRHFEKIRHVHINETDGRHCGTGDYDFQPIFETLARRGYTGWISLEAFDFTPGALTIANDSLRYIESVIARLDQKAAVHD